MNSYKKLFIINLLPVFLVFILFLGAAYIYDPLQLFHKPWLREGGKFHSNMRLQNAGIINNYDFDSIIIGNSRLENTSSKEVASFFGGNFVNLSMSGSINYERHVVLDYILNKKTIKTVFTQLDLLTPKKHKNTYILSNWAYLYDNNRWNDLKAYLDSNLIKCIATFSNSEMCVGEKKDLDRPNAWFRIPDYQARFGGIDNWILNHNNSQISSFLHEKLKKYANKPINNSKQLTHEEQEEIKTYINNYIIADALNYPETSFIFIVTPLSRISDAIIIRDEGVEERNFWLRYLVEKASEINNLEIYAFGDREFVDDIANYKDLGHYSEKINSYMVQAVAKKDGLLTLENVEQYIDTCTTKTREFDLKALSDYVEKKLELQK